MKNLLKTVLFTALGAVLFASCNKNDFDWEAERARILKEEEAIVTLLEEQKIKIEKYVADHFDNPIEDEKTIVFDVLDRKDVKRGIWYEIISEPTDDSYEYKLNANQSNVIFPTWKLNYKVFLLSDSETPVQSDESGGTYNMSAPSNANIFTQAWIISLFPSIYKVNGDIPYIGLTEKGQKTGSKIRVIVPSIYGYGVKGADKIPANSPLVYEFEVLGIE